MKRNLVGLVLLAVVIAGGAVAFGQSSGAPDPLTARITELQDVYRQVIVDVGALLDQRAAIDEQLKALQDQKLRLEGGIMELQRLQSQPPVTATGVVVPEPEQDVVVETE